MKFAPCAAKSPSCVRKSAGFAAIAVQDADRMVRCAASGAPADRRVTANLAPAAAAHETEIVRRAQKGVPVVLARAAAPVVLHATGIEAVPKAGAVLPPEKAGPATVRNALRRMTPLRNRQPTSSTLSNSPVDSASKDFH